MLYCGVSLLNVRSGCKNRPFTKYGCGAVRCGAHPDFWSKCCAVRCYEFFLGLGAVRCGARKNKLHLGAVLALHPR